MEVTSNLSSVPPRLFAHRAILRGVEELVREGSASSFQGSAPRTGVIWSSCEQIAKLPKSNKVAYRRAILQVREEAGPEEEDVRGSKSRGERF